MRTARLWLTPAMCLLCWISAWAQEGGGASSGSAALLNSQIGQLLSPEGRVVYGSTPNALMVIDHPENLRLIQEFLDVVDSPSPQVAIEARLVEVKLQGEHALGVQWTAFEAKTGGVKIGAFRVTTPVQQSIAYKNTIYPPVSTSGATENPFTMTIFDENISIVLNTLANHLDTEILSAPRITTLNNTEAEIRVIRRLPWAEPSVVTTEDGITVTWEINWEEVGIVLLVTPTIDVQGKQVSMALAPEISEHVSDFELTVVAAGTTVEYTVPIIDTRTATTRVIVGNNQTLIIGGLISDKTTAGASKIPYIGDVPFLGALFRSKLSTRNKTELLIFVSPTIITPETFLTHAKEEKFGVGRGFFSQRTRDREWVDDRAAAEREEAQLAAIHEVQRTITLGQREAEKLDITLQSLEAQQDAIKQERQTLEDALAEEEKHIQGLQEREESLMEEQRSLGGRSTQPAAE